MHQHVQRKRLRGQHARAFLLPHGTDPEQVTSGNYGGGVDPDWQPVP